MKNLFREITERKFPGIWNLFSTKSYLLPTTDFHTNFFSTGWEDALEMVTSHDVAVYFRATLESSHMRSLIE